MSTPNTSPYFRLVSLLQSGVSPIPLLRRLWSGFPSILCFVTSPGQSSAVLPMAYAWNRQALFSPWSSPSCVVGPSPHTLGFLLTSLATAISFPWLGPPPVQLKCPGPNPWASSLWSVRSHPWSSYPYHGCRCDLVSGQVPMFISPARPFSCTKEHPRGCLTFLICPPRQFLTTSLGEIPFFQLLRLKPLDVSSLDLKPFAETTRKYCRPPWTCGKKKKKNPVFDHFSPSLYYYPTSVPGWTPRTAS